MIATRQSRTVRDFRGDMTKTKRVLGWEPKVQFRELVRMMVDADLADVRENGDSTW